ncbi:inner membrane protein [Citrobacter braakii]|nr:inner membrane protein [Citrobacter braakii]
MTNLRLQPDASICWWGLSLVMFYLLLLALSEHIGFYGGVDDGKSGGGVDERCVSAGDIAGLAEQYFVHRGAAGGWMV